MGKRFEIVVPEHAPAYALPYISAPVPSDARHTHGIRNSDQVLTSSGGRCRSRRRSSSSSTRTLSTTSLLLKSAPSASSTPRRRRQQHKMC